MKSVVMAKSYLMGTVCPLVIFLIAGVLDYVTNEGNLMFTVMIVEGVILLMLPVFFGYREDKLKSECPTKWIAPMYLAGYAVITLLAVIAINTIDMSKLFPHQFLGGIGLFMVWIVMAGGFVWALIFRIGALIAHAVSKNKS